MALEPFFKDDLIKINIECESRNALFEVLANEAYKKGYVSERYLQKVKERESVFPTGLSMNQYNVAIPHTDPEYVFEQFIAIATLKYPVKFCLMENPAKEADVNVVLLLGLNEPHSQIAVLQQIMQIIQDGKKIDQILSAQSKEEIHLIFKQIDENTNGGN